MQSLTVTSTLSYETLGLASMFLLWKSLTTMPSIRISSSTAVPFGRRQRPHVGERHLAAELVVLVGLRDVEVGREGLLPAVDVAQVDDRLADVVARVGFRVDDQHALLGLHAANPVSGRTDVGSRDGEVPERDVGVDLELGEGLDAAADRLVGSRTFERRNHAVLLDADRVGPCAAVEHEAQFGHAAERIVLRKGDRNHPVAVEFRPVDRSPASDVVERLDPDPAVGIKLYLGGSADAGTKSSCSAAVSSRTRMVSASSTEQPTAARAARPHTAP